MYRWTEPGLFLLNHCSNYPKVSVCCLFIKNWIVVKGHSIPRGSQWKNRSDKESWGFTIDTAVNEHLTWSASLWVGPGLTQFWKHVQKVWMCGRCPRPTGPVSSRRSISSSVEHCLGSRRAVCCLFQPDIITEFAKYSKTFPLCMWYLWTILFKCKRLKFVTGIFFVIFKVS